MNKFFIILVVVCLCRAAGAAVTGPAYPLPTGNGFSSSGSSVGTGGSTGTYSGMDTTQYSFLEWGKDSTQDVTVNNNVLTLSASTIGTSAAQWTGTMAYNDGLGFSGTIPVRFTLTSTTPAMTFQSGPVAGADVVIDLESNLSGTSASFSVNRLFEGFYQGSWQPLGNLRNTSGLSTNFTGAFYYTPAPEPASLAAIGFGAVSLLTRRRGRVAR